MKVGDIFETNNCGKIIISEFSGRSKIRIRFLDTGYETYSSRHTILSGCIKDKMKPSVLGVGFLGEGIHDNGSSKLSSMAMIVWRAMLARCYSGRKGYEHYEDCEVCEEWQNFQIFAEWFIENYPNDGCDYDLDKDKILKGNRTYHPDLCCFLTRTENSVISASKSASFISPDGEVFDVFNITEFCRDKNLRNDCMSRVSLGKQSNHKGWRLNDAN